MKPQELIVTCYYTEDAPDAKAILLSTFASFLNREIEIFASMPHDRVS